MRSRIGGFEAGAATFDHEALGGGLVRLAGGSLQRIVRDWTLSQGRVVGQCGRSRHKGFWLPRWGNWRQTSGVSHS
jgi:hypothetical protein